jgi:branched-chain amino acid aminotransferase
MIAYVNGEYVPHGEAVVSIDDRGLMFGDAVFEITRTFGGVPFKLDEHFERLERSLRYVEMPTQPVLSEVRQASRELIAQNADEIEECGDVWLEQIVTRGLAARGDGPFTATGPTVIVKLRALPFAGFAPFYVRGVDLHVSLLTLPFTGPMDPRAKAANRLSNVRADLKGQRMRAAGGGHWTLIFNGDGSVAETNAANLCIIQGDALIHPSRYETLGGISLETLCDLAKGLGLEVIERRLTFYDLVNANETMIAATSFCVLPVARIDGISVRPATRVYPDLVKAWTELLEFDFVEQATSRAGILSPPVVE